jgi:hypothetical protein
MIGRSVLVVVAWIMTAAAIQSPADVNSGRVTGVVVDDTGAAVPFARVGLIVDRESFADVQQADEAGRFAFTDVAPGSYELIADKAGFVGLVWHQLPPEARVDVTAGQTTTASAVRLMRGGVIEGRVLLADGTPAVGAEVGVYRFDADRFDSLRFSPAGRVNSHGEFRLFGFPAGEYWLYYGSDHEPVAQLPGEDHAKVELRMYFPGTYFEGEAAAISVRAGATEDLGTLMLVPAPLSRVRGTIVVPEGLSLSSARVVCHAKAAPDSRHLRYESETMVNAEMLTFDCGFVSDGLHEVQVTATAPPEMAGGERLDLEGRAVVTVSGNESTIVIRLQRAIRPVGRLGATPVIPLW